MAYVQQSLGPDEKILFESRRHAFVLMGHFLKELLILAVLIAGWVVIRNDLEFFWLQIALGLIAILVLGSMLIDWVRWNSEVFYITNRRVIHTSGVFNKKVLDSSISKINDVILEQSFLGRIFDYGTIKILTATDEVITRVDKIARPLDFKKAMLGAKTNLEPMATPVLSTSPTQMLEELAQLKAKNLISEEEYNEKRKEILKRI